METQSKEQKVQGVTQALESPEYDWRTVDGISADTGLDRDTISNLLQEMGNELIKSSVPDNKGRSLYTTRKHYKKSQPLWNRIVTSVSDVVK